MSVLAMRHDDDKSWANQYLLDPLNPVEAWQTAQVGGQYSNAIPTQHNHYAKSPISGPSPRSPTSSSGFIGRSQSQRIPGRAPSVRQNENYNPFRPASSAASTSVKSSSAYSEAPTSRSSRPRSDISNYEHRPRERRPLESSAGPSRSSQQPHSPRSPRERASHSSRSPRYKPTRGVPVDLIDSLDTSFGGAYHHDGPFDATLAARNRTPWKSPVEATKIGNQMALQATLDADIENSLEEHRPLDGVAAFPPGTQAGNRRLSYEEYDIQRLDGNFRRWDGIKYLDEDLKGKGTEGYEGDKLEKSLQKSKSVKGHRRGLSEDANSYEMQSRGESTDADIYQTNGLRRGGSTAGRLENVGAKIKRRFSLSRKPRRSMENQ